MEALDELGKLAGNAPPKPEGAMLLLVARPKHVYWRAMGQYTKKHPGENGKTHVSHLRGYGGPVRYRSVEEFELKMRLMQAIALMEDAPGQEGAVLAQLRATTAALQETSD